MSIANEKKFPSLILGDDGIFREYHFDSIISKPCAMFVADERNRLSDRKRPLLVQFQHLKGYAAETRDMNLNFVLNSVSALAYAVDITTKEGQDTKELIDSFFHITNWPIPVKIFDDEDKALQWLATFL
ncbi:MAG: hypothetical protein OEZ58_03055 [Gammaproteobacteria bacterium]|nr:hypothetical protein [Gammaproteobacteria bacterium]MDH5727942.1 hypothetical protein [Gammaproteobacteria bacterium]